MSTNFKSLSSFSTVFLMSLFVFSTSCSKKRYEDYTKENHPHAHRAENHPQAQPVREGQVPQARNEITNIEDPAFILRRSNDSDQNLSNWIHHYNEAFNIDNVVRTWNKKEYLQLEKWLQGAAFRRTSRAVAGRDLVPFMNARIFFTFDDPDEIDGNEDDVNTMDIVVGIGYTHGFRELVTNGSMPYLVYELENGPTNRICEGIPTQPCSEILVLKSSKGLRNADSVPQRIKLVFSSPNIDTLNEDDPDFLTKLVWNFDQVSSYDIESRETHNRFTIKGPVSLTVH